MNSTKIAATATNEVAGEIRAREPVEGEVRAVPEVRG
jgi:hypothetical protein